MKEKKKVRRIIFPRWASGNKKISLLGVIIFGGKVYLHIKTGLPA
jgi:hypothetical protein